MTDLPTSALHVAMAGVSFKQRVQGFGFWASDDLSNAQLLRKGGNWMHVARVADENEGLQTICSCRLARWLGRARWLDHFDP